MKAKLVRDNGRQRFYELSEPLNIGICDIRGLLKDLSTECVDVVKKRIRPEYHDTIVPQFADGVRIVCVSDAFTHIERLVFPAFIAKDEYHGLSVNIDGKHTFMIDGGDSESVYEDAVYLRHLAIINNLSWEGVEN